MPTLADPTDVLIQEASSVPLAEALSLPTDRLLGVSEPITTTRPTATDAASRHPRPALDFAVGGC
jgi:hypothetical protein